MKDRERIDDTDPTGPPVDTADTDPGDVTDPEDTSPGEPGDVPSEDDTEDFLRWLPTMWVGHRRRKELVERPSSEGADFAAYACEGRPVAASARVPHEAKVQVRTDVSARSGSPDRGDSDDASEVSGRDALTVVKRRRSFASGRAVLGWGAAGFLMMSASILWWPHRPQAAELPARARAAAAVPLPTARMEAERVEAPASLPPTAGLQGEAQSANPPVAPAAQQTTASASLLKAMKEARRKGERAVLAPPGGFPRAPASVAAAPVQVKEQYFEDP